MYSMKIKLEIVLKQDHFDQCTSEQACMTDLGTSSNRTQQLGCVSHGGCTVDEGGGELGCLTEVMFLVFRRFVHNTCITYNHHYI